MINDDASDPESAPNTENDNDEKSELSLKSLTPVLLPPRTDGDIVPIVEWWDEVYLSRENREIRKKSVKGAGASSSSGNGKGSVGYSDFSGVGVEVDVYKTASILHTKSHM